MGKWDSKIFNWLNKESELNFFTGFGLSLVFYIFLCGMLIIQNSNNSNNLQLFLMSVPSLLLVVVTAAYVFLTQKLVKTNQALFDAQSEPIVISHLKHNEIEDPELIELIIENVGLGTARNIKFEVNPKGFDILTGNFDSHSLIQRGISVLGPKQKVRVKLCYIFYFANKTQREFHPDKIPKFQITITYQNSIGKNIGPEHFDIDIEMYKDQ